MKEVSFPDFNVMYINCRYVWVLEGDTGKVLEGWPVKLPSEVRATVLVTKLVPGESSAADIVSSYSYTEQGNTFNKCWQQRNSTTQAVSEPMSFRNKVTGQTFH